MVCACVVKLEEALIRRIVQMDSPIDLDRGQPRKTISQTIKRDLEVNGISLDPILDSILCFYRATAFYVVDWSI